jgi:hypothetical protein
MNTYGKILVVPSLKTRPPEVVTAMTVLLLAGHPHRAMTMEPPGPHSVLVSKVAFSFHYTTSNLQILYWYNTQVL